MFTRDSDRAAVQWLPIGGDMVDRLIVGTGDGVYLVGLSINLLHCRRIGRVSHLQFYQYIVKFSLTK